MASIKISDLCPSGCDSFGDSESFLDELSDNDLTTIKGGETIIVVILEDVIVIIILP